MLKILQEYKTPRLPDSHVLPRGGIDSPTLAKLLLRRARELGWNSLVISTLYGQSAPGLSRLINIPIEEAKIIINSFFASDPSIEKYVRWTKNFVAAHGYVTTILGRRRRFPIVNMDGRQRAAAQRKGVNFLIQSTCSDLVLERLVEIDRELEAGLGGQLLITVHDSVVLEMPIQSVPKATDFFNYWFTERVHEKHKWFPVSFSCDIEVGNSYGELMSVENFMKQEYNLVEEDERDRPDLRLLTEEDPDEAHKIDLEEEGEPDEN